MRLKEKQHTHIPPTRYGQLVGIIYLTLQLSVKDCIFQTWFHYRVPPTPHTLLSMDTDSPPLRGGSLFLLHFASRWWTDAMRLPRIGHKEQHGFHWPIWDPWPGNPVTSHMQRPQTQPWPPIISISGSSHVNEQGFRKFQPLAFELI